jgi:hypothetical protein
MGVRCLENRIMGGSDLCPVNRSSRYEIFRPERAARRLSMARKRHSPEQIIGEVDGRYGGALRGFSRSRRDATRPRG